MTVIVFNPGGRIQVTPGASEPLTVTFEGRTTFSQAWNTDVATTIDNFISTHAQDIADQFKVFLVDGTTTLDLYGMGSLEVTSSGTVGAQAKSYEEAITLESIVGFSPTDNDTLVVNLDEAATPSADDVLTLNFTSTEDMEKFKSELIEAKKSTSGVYVFNVAHQATLA